MSTLSSTQYLLKYTHKSEYSVLTRVLLKHPVLSTYLSTEPQCSVKTWFSSLYTISVLGKIQSLILVSIMTFNEISYLYRANKHQNIEQST